MTDEDKAVDTQTLTPATKTDEQMKWTVDINKYEKKQPEETVAYTGTKREEEEKKPTCRQM